MGSPQNRDSSGRDAEAGAYRPGERKGNPAGKGFERPVVTESNREKKNGEKVGRKARGAKKGRGANGVMGEKVAA